MRNPDLPRHATRFAIGLFILLGLLISGCPSGGGDATGSGSTDNPLWVSIDTTSTTVQTSSVDLHGIAYCDNCPASEVALGYCPAFQGPLSSAVGITWKNRTTGATGIAVDGIYGYCSCLFSYCVTSYSHRWMAFAVPLNFGANLLEVSASNTTGASATGTVTLSRIPASPVSLSAVAGSGEVTLGWNSVAGATSYNLYWSTTADLTVSTGTRIAAVGNPYLHTGLTDNVTYYYLVTAVIGGLESPPSAMVFATPGWKTEFVAPTTVSTDMTTTSIAADSTSGIHVHDAYNQCTHYSTIPNSVITYCDAYSYFNNYITDAAGSWVAQAIGPSPYVDAHIAVDSSGAVHVGYAGYHGVIHAIYAGGTWAAETVDAQGGCDSSLALDAANKVYVSYYANSASASELRYATNASGAWVHNTIDLFTQDIGCDMTAASLSIAVDAAGTAHIAYAGKFPDYGLEYATNQSGGWINTTLDSSDITNLSAALDSNGKTHVIYADNNHQIRYAHQDETDAWIIEVVAARSGDYPSLALDASGHAHISYVSALNGSQLIYASNDAGSWRFLPIDTADFAATAIALDPLGKVHISYFSSGNLMNATNK
ncbi:MAG: hypothetical protein WCA64_08215 [Gallionella sp.]